MLSYDRYRALAEESGSAPNPALAGRESQTGLLGSLRSAISSSSLASVTTSVCQGMSCREEESEGPKLASLGTAPPVGEGAMQVTVGDGEEVSSSGRGASYTAYPIEVSLDGVCYRSQHRYSEFRELVAELSQWHAHLPELPRRTLPFEKPGGSFFEDRRAGLEAFLRRLGVREACMQDPALRRFLALPPRREYHYD